MAELGSKWTGLSEHLIASFWQCDKDGKSVDDKTTVKAPLLSGSNLEIIMNWQSPFENLAQSSLPTFQQMIQGGALLPLANIVDKTFGSNTSGYSKKY